MSKGKVKGFFTKSRIRIIIISAVAVAVIVAFVITNLFVPVKYLSAYFTLGNKGAKRGEMRVRFIDVGYGDCAVVELPDGKNMLVDGGDGSYKNQLEIFRFLNKCGIDKIDYLICTSVTREHCGGLAEIVKYKDISSVFVPYAEKSEITPQFEKFCAEVKAVGAEIKYCEYGEGVAHEDGYFFTFLCPPPHALDAGQNGASAAMLWLEYADTSFLFCGDVGEDRLSEVVTEYILQSDYFDFRGRAVDLFGCDVLSVPAHGAASAQYAPFYDLLSPETAIISTGGDGSPAEGVLSDVINSVGENLYITESYGTVTIIATAEGYSVV